MKGVDVTIKLCCDILSPVTKKCFQQNLTVLKVSLTRQLLVRKSVIML